MSFVAIESGEVFYDGRYEWIRAGETHVCDERELVRRYPRMFKRAPSTRLRGDAILARALVDATRTRATRTAVAPRVTQGRPTRVDRYDPELRRTARHEAAHAAVAVLIGWEVTSIEIRRDGSGATNVLAPRGVSREQKAAGSAVIAAAAERHVG